MMEAGGASKVTRGAREFVGCGEVLEEVRRLARTAEVSPFSLASTLAREEGRLENGVPRVATGFARLDAALSGGLVVPSLSVLGAPPKAGKSTFSQMLAVHFAEHHGVAYYLDLENGPARFMRQILCRRARCGPREVAAALAHARGGVFRSRDDLERWKEAKEWARSLPLYVDFTPPSDMVARIESMRRFAGDRPLFVGIDSLQKLPMALEDRRAGIDGWLRLFERLRQEHNLVLWVVSEIRRGREGYAPREDAFKESGSIEYTADLAMTLSRPAADEGEERVSTLRVELARDCDEDPAGDVASYAPVRPFYGLEEREPVERKGSGRRGPRAEKTGAARDWLMGCLAGGPLSVDQVLRDGEAAGHSRTRLYEARKALGVRSCTVGLASGWRLA
jgi:KaiC/GvpD/RAD55 family RecA-like ATPase